MKHLLAIIAIVLLLGGPVAAAPVIGEAAPGFAGNGADGEALSLDGFAGQKIVLEWTSHDCLFVVKHYSSGNMQRTQSALRDAGYTWIQVISSAPGKQGHVSGEEANDLNARRGAYVDHVFMDPDGTMGHAYAAKTTPHMYIIDEGGVLRYMGAIDSIRSARPSDIPKATNYVLAALDALNAGETVAESSTRAYGCTVKYK